MRIEAITPSITGANGPTRAKLMAGQARDGHQSRPVRQFIVRTYGGFSSTLSGGGEQFAVPDDFGFVSRVDLGLRLERGRPTGRLLAARDLGAATVRIPLTRPGEVDAEVVGWLRRAYQENAAPPPPRRPARRQAPQLGSLTAACCSVPGDCASSSSPGCWTWLTPPPSAKRRAGRGPAALLCARGTPLPTASGCGRRRTPVAAPVSLARRTRRR
jgi:hypothetical protein